MAIRDFDLCGLNSYQLLFALGCAGTIGAYLRAGRRCGLPEKALVLHVLCVAALAYWGARLLYGAQHASGAGSASYGALAAGVAAFELLRRVLGLEVARTYDSAAVAVPVMVILGRLGCFFGGCCFGTPTDLGWAVRYPARGCCGESPAFASHHAQSLVSATDAVSLPVHPVQLYLALWAVAGLATVLWLRRRGLCAGKRMLVFGFLHCAGRFSLEFLRGDDRAVFGPWHAEHLFSLLGMLLVAALAARGPIDSTLSPAASSSRLVKRTSAQ